MKHFDRPQEIPAILTTKGVKETEKNKKLYNTTPVVKRANIDFEFKPSIYRHSSIKKKLIEIQQNTCCYCETSLVSSTGDVEHYRPKGKCKQSKENKEFHKPGYFWLAYSWNNLMLACKRCNSSNKIDYFPVDDPNKRLTPDGKNDTVEKPLILNPYELSNEEISRHLDFRGAEEFGKTVEGGVTVNYCGLNDSELKNDRNKLFSKLQHKKETIAVCRARFGEAVSQFVEQELRNDIKKYLEEGEYTLMIRCNFKEFID